MAVNDRQEPSDGGLNKFMSDIFADLGHYDASMERDRPYTGEPHTCAGIRGATEIKGITFRDLRDAFIRAVLLSAHHVKPELYAEADKGPAAALCEDDLFGWDLNAVDPIAISQNLGVEVEKLMGIYPNVPQLTDESAR